jgi:nucleoside-diphosphate-sugar epimerase
VGGHGFIGSHFCKILNKNNFIYDIYDIGEPSGDPDNETIDKRKKGLPVSKSYVEIKNEQYDSVVHLGSYAGIRSNRNSLDYFKNNVLNYINLLKDISFNKIIYISSSSVLGDVETPYSLSKKIAEKITLDHKNAYVIRPFTVYGDFGRPELLITKLKKKERLIINGDPHKLKRRFTHVDDLNNLIFWALKSGINTPKRIINAIGIKEYSVYEILKIFNHTDYEVGDYDNRDFKKMEMDDSLNFGCIKKIEDYANEE